MTDTRTADAEHDRPDAGAHLRAARVQLEPYDVFVGPVGHLAEERTRLAGLRWRNFG
jgi:hypothetical protein